MLLLHHCVTFDLHNIHYSNQDNTPYYLMDNYYHRRVLLHPFHLVYLLYNELLRRQTFMPLGKFAFYNFILLLYH